MSVKFYQCYTDVTIVTVHFNMPSLRIECYGVTVLQPINVQKSKLINAILWLL